METVTVIDPHEPDPVESYRRKKLMDAGFSKEVARQIAESRLLDSELAIKALKCVAHLETLEQRESFALYLIGFQNEY